MRLENTLQKTTLILISITLVYLIITTFKTFFMPIAIAALFALMLYPAAKYLEERKLPRILSNLLVIIGLVTIISLVLFGISSVFRGFLSDLPAIQENLNTNLAGLELRIENRFDIPVEQQQAWLSENFNLGAIFGPAGLGSLFRGTSNFILMAGVTIVYTFFFLYYRTKFKEVIYRLTPSVRHDVIDNMLDDMDEVAPHYMLGMFVVVMILTIINSAGFLIIGVDQAIFFGVISALLNLIPFIGTIFGFLVVIAFTIATQTPQITLGVIIMLVIVQFIDNNILTPSIAASRISLNPLAAIMVIFLGNIIWGVVGMIVALPFLAMFKIVADAVPSLQPVGYLIGTTGTERHAFSYRNIRHRWTSFTKKKHKKHGLFGRKK